MIVRRYGDGVEGEKPLMMLHNRVMGTLGALVEPVGEQMKVLWKSCCYATRSGFCFFVKTLIYKNNCVEPSNNEGENSADCSLQNLLSDWCEIQHGLSVSNTLPCSGLQGRSQKNIKGSRAASKSWCIYGETSPNFFMMLLRFIFK